MRICGPVTALIAAGLLASLVLPAAAQTIHLEFVGAPGRADVPVTPVCSTWHELYPSFCLNHHQDGYADDGDGFISACDWIVLDAVNCHIDWVGPTYHLVSITDQRLEMYLEPQEGAPGRNPVCETWHEVYPDYCVLRHVDGWEDNGDGSLGPCDIIYFAGEPWHLADVGLNIIVTPESPVEEGTWSGVKRLFSTLFGS